MKESEEKKGIHQIKDLPTDHGHIGESTCWTRSSGCFIFITDCKPLADILCGHAPLKVPSLTPIFERMSRCLFQIFEQSLSPPACTDDPVVWRRRECNQIPDFLVNYTMDHQNSWHKDFDPITGVDFELVNYVCHSDGGRRSETCAASAWYLEARVSSN